MYEEILKLLMEPKFRYNGITFNMLGMPSFLFRDKQAKSNAVYMMKKKGYIERVGADKIMIRPNGIKYLEKRMQRLQYFDSPFNKSSKKDLLVVFDIPEDRKAEREWFRKQLKMFNYEMVQKSIWLGPSPLPKEFTDYVKSIGMKKYIKTFKLKQAIYLIVAIAFVRYIIKFLHKIFQENL